MKTPRKILLERHQAVVPQLDAIRRESVGQASSLSQNKKSETGRMPVLRLIWLELILPSRRIWAGLAAVWLLLLVVNFSMRDHLQMTMAKTSTPAEVAATFQQQQELLAQLIGPNEPVVAEPQKKYVPRPSSWRTFEIITT
jgi:hypothetical protein